MKSFIEFVKLLGNVTLTPAQRVLAAVAFDRVEPRDLVGVDRDLARQLFGPDVETIPPAARAVLVLVAGGRGGKTYLGALRLLHLALTSSVSGLASGESAYAVIVAPDLRLARQALSFCKGAIHWPSLSRMQVQQTADSLSLKRPDGRQVVIECLPATRGGSAIRGRTLVACLLDECAFFRSQDDASVVNDSEIFAAAAPRILAGGQMILSSTPWIESGVLFNFFRDQWGRPRTALVAHAPTVLLNPSKQAEVEAEFDRDPTNAAREFGAEFGSVSGGTWFDGRSIDDSKDVGRTGPLPPNGAPCTAAIDLAFSSDASALAIVREDDGKVVLVDWLERKPKRGEPLKPSQVIAEFAERARQYGCQHLIGDAHYQEMARENLTNLRMGFHTTPGGATGKEQTYRRAQSILNERKVSLPDLPRLLQQFRDTTAKPLPGGGVQISHPRRSGQGHGDLCAAVILAIAHCRRASRRENIDHTRFKVDPNSWAALHARTDTIELVMTAEGPRMLPAGSPRPREPKRNQFGSGSGF